MSTSNFELNISEEIKIDSNEKKKSFSFFPPQKIFFYSLEEFNYKPSYVLFFCLILIAIIFGNLEIALKYNSFAPTSQVCKNPKDQLILVKEILYNFTNTSYYENQTNYVENIYLTAWNLANETHDSWPEPREMSEEEKENLLRASKKTCRKRVCIDGWGLSILCKRVSIPCPDPNAINTLNSYDEWQKEWENLNNTEEITGFAVSQEFLDIMNEFVFRITTTNTFYVIYRAFTIFFGSSVIIYKKSIKTRLANCQISKFRWILGLIIFWYLAEYIINFMNTTEFNLYFSSIHNNPCLLDKDYLNDVFLSIKETCENLDNLENRWTIAKQNYEYHLKIDESYVIFGGEKTFFEYVLNEPFMVNWNATCNENELVKLSYQTTISSNPDFIEWFRRISGFLLLFLQGILALFVIGIFSLFWPLSANGKYYVGLHKEENEVIYSYVRCKGLIESIIYGFLLFIILFGKWYFN